MKNTFLLSFLLLAWAGVNAQKIENVTATQQGKNIVVSYDLTGSSSSEFDVSVYCSTDGGSTFGNPLYSVTGDVGNSIKTGYNKQITWNVLADREKLSGNRILFEVRAKLKNTAVNDLGFEMVFVKGGLFTMGCDSYYGDCDDDEKPAHLVILSDFYIGKYEVTQKQWRTVMGAPTSLGDPSYFKNCDNCPVEQVTWNDVQEFIKKLNQKTGKNYRLPTEAEWEYAARGGSADSPTTYAGSDNINEVAWSYKNSGDSLLNNVWYYSTIEKNHCRTHPVGQKRPNALGIYDMSGNVCEWCNDWYDDYCSKYSNIQIDPKGPLSGHSHVIRGGSWELHPQYCRVLCRSFIHISSDVGFRIAHD